MSKRRWVAFCSLLLTISLLIAFGLSSFGMFFDLALASVFFLMVLCWPLLLERLRWYEPVCALNAMFAFLGLAGLYMAATGFSTAEHAIHDVLDLKQRAPYTMLYVTGWLVAFYIGYGLVRKVPPESLSGEAVVNRIEGFDPSLLKTVAAGCFFIGVVNAVYNIWLFSPGDPLKYFMNFGVSRYRDQVNEGVFTTLGYHFLIVSLIFYRCSFPSWDWKRLILFGAALLISLLIIVSRGQIFFTFSVVLFLLVLEYFFSITRSAYLRCVIFVVPLLFVFMILAYFLRLVSVEAYIAGQVGQSIDFSVTLMEKIKGFGGLIFGKGNVPNLPAMLVYEDHFGGVEDFILGESLTNWLAAFLPSFDGTYIGYKISEIWYPNNVGGIPPGVVHELYANFGMFGSYAFSIVFGGFAAALFNRFSRERSFILCVIYSAFLVRFWFILPKVEFTVFSNAIWLFLPTVAVFLFVSMISRIFSSNSYHK
ncbi:hypothetical protein [Marinobacter sp. F4216]|uniref:hypothetical protein n=1 Tax=Marinobacter sp. F4216 TaxID=2874281 RepID=UPI001CC0BA6E|nr:hypothetical protein [Marinobacter sp. F4216]MBZ2168419.1 hypothetical protein [Marinobacter sp. F4216]